MKKQIDIIRSIIYSREEIVHVLAQWRLKSQKIVFTNGCFDILHNGHVDYLSRASDLGDKLVVGLNSDDSVKRLGKGEDRPIQDEDARAILLAALRFVDAVVLFSEETPLELIKSINPDVLVKGSDYEIENIVGSEFVIGNGGEVKTIDFLPGYSTSSIIGKIRKS